MQTRSRNRSASPDLAGFPETARKCRVSGKFPSAGGYWAEEVTEIPFFTNYDAKFGSPVS
jgi:hypothetical protein